jgi:NAD(P)H-dependent flavin oxidoreductase YrpB (nitropropane dioxygenase family)
MRTRITELLHCRYPILQGAMAGLGDWRLAAAVANSGAYGTITASTAKTPEGLREDIQKCRESTTGAFGVNLSFGLCPEIEKMLEVCIEEGIPVETAMYKPDSVARRIKESGIAWIHKCARVKDAVHAEAMGVDAVILVGLEGTGFKSPEQLPVLTTLLQSRKISVPVIVGGGLADGCGLVAALAMGAEAIMMGTAFMLTKECMLKESVKEQIVKTGLGDARLVHRVLGSVDPKAYAQAQDLKGKVPLDQWLRTLERVGLKDELQVGPGAGPDGRAEGGSDPMRMVSLAVAGIDHVRSVKELVDDVVVGADCALTRLRDMMSG